MRKPTLRPGNAAREELIERRITELENRIRSIQVRSSPSSTSNDVTTISQTTHGFAAKDVIRYTAGAWAKSKADTAANAVVGGIVLAVLSPDVFVLATAGHVFGLTGLTAGSVHYLSAATAGLLTTTAPAIAIPILLADSTTSGVLLSMSQGGGLAPTEDGTVFAADSTGLVGEWVRDLDLGRNVSAKAGKLRILSPDASGVAVEIDGTLVTSSGKKLTIREIDVCDAGTAKKMLVIASATY